MSLQLVDGQPRIGLLVIAGHTPMSHSNSRLMYQQPHGSEPQSWADALSAHSTGTVRLKTIVRFDTYSLLLNAAGYPMSYMGWMPPFSLSTMQNYHVFGRYVVTYKGVLRVPYSTPILRHIPFCLTMDSRLIQANNPCDRGVKRCNN